MRGVERRAQVDERRDMPTPEGSPGSIEAVHRSGTPVVIPAEPTAASLAALPAIALVMVFGDTGQEPSETRV